MTTDAVRVALLQMTSGIDAAANSAAIISALNEAVSHGAKMMFTPEMALLLDRDRARAAETVEGGGIERAIGALQSAAADTGMWLHIGSAPVADPAAAPRWANRSLLIGPDGEIKASYDKLHMFDVQLGNGESWRESNGFAPGDAVVSADDTPIGRLGLSICYDLRFAALYDRLGAMGCDCIAIPAAFTVPTGSAHWHVLQRARAIEQGCFVIAAAQVGHHADGRQTYGHSMVVSPWGEVLCDAGERAGLHIVDVDLSAVAAARAQIPAIAHRRALPEVTG
jgi:deaminated glutathione amidase